MSFSDALMFGFAIGLLFDPSNLSFDPDLDIFLGGLGGIANLVTSDTELPSKVALLSLIAALP